jgi:hypothetical protein
MTEAKESEKPEDQGSASSHCSPSFTYYVMSEGELMGFNECPEDAFDDESDVVFRRVSWAEDAVLHPGYGKRIDEVVRMFPEVDDPKIEDGYRVKAEVTIGWLRCVNALAGYLQGESRIRNPEFCGMFHRAD